MTIAYTEGIKSLKRWRGSVWRSVWKELILWLIVYYVVRFILAYVPQTAYQQQLASDTVSVFRKFCDQVPVSFLLGFYITQIVTRWWNQVLCIPYPDEVMSFANAYFRKPEEKYIRQTIARWLILCQAMVFRRISTRIRRRFPKFDTLVVAGLVTPEEQSIIRGTMCVNNRWQLPLHWMVHKIIMNAKLQATTESAIIGAINRYSDSMKKLYLYDWIGEPSVQMAIGLGSPSLPLWLTLD